MRLREPIRFLIVGVANTMVGLGTIFAAKALLDFGDIAANMAGYSLGLIVSFVLNRQWTFLDSGAIGPAALRFLLTFAVSYTINLATVLGLIALGMNSYLAQTLGTIPYTVTFYLLSRYVVFLSRSRPLR